MYTVKVPSVNCIFTERVCVFYMMLSGAHILILVRSTVLPYKFPDSY